MKFALAGAAWGSAFLLIAEALDAFDPALIGLLRNASAALAIGVVVALGGDAPKRALRMLLRRPFLALAAGAVGFTLPLLLVATAEHHLASGFVATVMASSPLLLALASPWLPADERVDRRSAAGVIIGMVGVVLVAGGHGLVTPQHALSVFLLLIASALSAAYPLIVKYWYHEVPAAASTLHAAVGGTVVLIPVLPFVASPTPPVAGPALATVGLGVVATALPFLTFTSLVADVGATRASLVYYLIPLTAVLLGVVLLGERPTLTACAGLALILLGVWRASS